MASNDENDGLTLYELARRVNRLQTTFNGTGLKVDTLISKVAQWERDSELREKLTAQHREEVKEALRIANGKTNLRLGLATLILGLLMAWLTYRDSLRKAENNPPQVRHSALSSQQDAGTQPNPSEK